MSTSPQSRGDGSSCLYQLLFSAGYTFFFYGFSASARHSWLAALAAVGLVGILLWLELALSQAGFPAIRSRECPSGQIYPILPRAFSRLEGMAFPLRIFIRSTLTSCSLNFTTLRNRSGESYLCVLPCRASSVL